jgi:hypothetical protein
MYERLPPDLVVIAVSGNPALARLEAAIRELQATLLPQRLVTVKEAAAIAGVSVSTMRRVRAKEVPSIGGQGKAVRLDPRHLGVPTAADVAPRLANRRRS